MLRLLNAFLSGGDYLPCRQVFQKNNLLCYMVKRYIKLEKFDLAIARAEMLFEGRVAFLAFLEHPQGKYSLLFENNDSSEYQMQTKAQLDYYVQTTVTDLKTVPNPEYGSKIKDLLKKYNLM